MALKNQVPNVYSVGLHNVGSYQVSGQPYLSGAITTSTPGSNIDGYYNFPSVSKRVVVTNNDASNDAIVSFAPFLEAQKGNHNFSNSASGSGNWLYLKAGTSIDLNVKSKEIFVAPNAGQAVNDISIYAELTNIHPTKMYSLDGVEGVTTFSPPSAVVPVLKNQVQNVYSSGIRNVGSFQVSGRPFITGSFVGSDASLNVIPQNEQIWVDFPKATKTLTVWNLDGFSPKGVLRVTFADTGSMTNYPANGCYYELAENESITLNVKCKKVFLSAVSGIVQWKLFAGLTGIEASQMYDLTGSGISE
jgi:hypothetical protein